VKRLGDDPLPVPPPRPGARRRAAAPRHLLGGAGAPGPRPARHTSSGSRGPSWAHVSAILPHPCACSHHDPVPYSGQTTPAGRLPGGVSPAYRGRACPADLRPAGPRPACRLVAGRKGAEYLELWDGADGRLRARRATREADVRRPVQRQGRGFPPARGAGRVVQRMTGASGARRTGLSNLIELTAASSVGDAFVAGRAGRHPVLQTPRSARPAARSRSPLLVTMAPFAVLAPLIGPMLDRVPQGRRFILAGNAAPPAGRCCWGHGGRRCSNHDSVTPAAGRVWACWYSRRPTA